MQLFIPRKKAIWRIPSLTNYTRKFMVSISEFELVNIKNHLFSRLIGAIEIHLSLGGLSRRQLLQVTFISIVNLQKSKTENNKFGIRNRIQIDQTFRDPGTKTNRIGSVCPSLGPLGSKKSSTSSVQGHANFRNLGPTPTMTIIQNQDRRSDQFGPSQYLNI